jgi:DNA-binding transcriptional LysR family regulator
MEIEYLREFMALSEHSSFSKASRKLSLAPSTFSRHIAALERHLDVVLIRRGTAEYQLTPEGQLFLELAYQAVTAYDEAVKRTKEMKAQNSRLLTIGGDLRLTSVMTLVANSITLLAHQRAPATYSLYERHSSSSIATLASHDTIESLLNGTLDVAVSIAYDELSRAGAISSLPLCQEPFMFFVNKEHPLAASRQPVRLIDFRDMVLITTLAYRSMYEHVLKVCREAGFELKTRVSVHRSYCDIYVARSINELFITPASNIGRIAPVDISGLVPVEVSDPDAFFTLTALWRTDDEKRGVALFLETIEKLAGSTSVTGSTSLTSLNSMRGNESS